MACTVLRDLERRNARRKFVERMHADVSRGVAPIHRRKGTDLMDARMDGWTAGTRRQTLNLHQAPSRTIAYLYYKTIVNSEIHYHKLDRHRIVHVNDGMPRRRNVYSITESPVLFTIVFCMDI